MKKKQLAKLTIKTLFQCIRTMKVQFILFMLAILLFVLVSPLQMYAQKSLFDEISLIFSHGDYKKIYLYIAIFCVSQILLFLNEATVNPIFEYTAKRFSFVLKQNITKKSNEMPAEYFEDVTFYDNIQKASQGAENANSVMMMTFGLFANILVLVSVITYLSYLNPLLSIAIFCSQVPQVIKMFFDTMANQKLRDSTINLQRRSTYLEKTFSTREYYKDTLLSGGVFYFFKKWKSFYDSFIGEKYKTEKKMKLYDFIVSGITFLCNISAFLISIYLFMNNKLTVGGFSVAITSTELLQSQLRNIIDIINIAIKNSVLATDYFLFMENKVQSTKERANDIVSNHKIHLDNVSFKYPNSTHNSLQNINLSLNNKEKIAIVGANGAGKTTLSKVIMALLTPTSGRIYYNNINITLDNCNELYKNATAVFQNFGRYNMSIHDNVIISDEMNRSDVKRFNDAIKISGFPIDKYSQNAELGREFAGIELSGGEWQRLAIARAYFRKYDTIIFDEPTAAIDPIMEKEILDKFLLLAEDKTVILITHRLGSARLADRILVMSEGEIIEEGSHEHLIAMDGTYAKMFTEQAKWYKR